MTCINCERARVATFYNRFVSKVGHASITMLTATAYHAGLRAATTGIQVTFDKETLTMSSKVKDVAVSVVRGSTNVTLVYKGTNHQVTVPEHAGFIVQGKPIPDVGKR